MLRRKILAVACLCAAVLLSGCAQPTAQSSAEPFVDDAGRTVTLKGSPQKIVSLSPSNTELLFALGLGERVVGVTEFCNYPPEALTKPKVGGFADVDAERVVSLGPDLVVAGSLHISTVVPELERLGLTVVVIEPATVDAVTARLVDLGKLTGREQAAEELKAKLGERIAATEARAKAAGTVPRVFWMVGDGLFTAGPGSFADDLIRRAGGTNIAADAKSQWPELSMEAVVKADPEVIVIPGPEGPPLAAKLKADPTWQGISAVKHDRFVLIENLDVVVRPGPRIADALDLIARGLHPEQSGQ